jgi:hypothetical protein
MTTKLITINNTRTAAVNQSLPWLPINQHTPVGVKLLLINRRLGVATIGNYQRGNDWTHWQGMPKFMEGISDDKEATTT